jgi:hypothetical protein
MQSLQYLYECCYRISPDLSACCALLPPAGYVSTGTARILNSTRMLVALHKVRGEATIAFKMQS